MTTLDIDRIVLEELHKINDKALKDKIRKSLFNPIKASYIHGMDEEETLYEVFYIARILPAPSPQSGYIIYYEGQIKKFGLASLCEKEYPVDIGSYGSLENAYESH